MEYKVPDKNKKKLHLLNKSDQTNDSYLAGTVTKIVLQYRDIFPYLERTLSGP